ncbi:type II toxin-antitoxin system PemK/MazF family toxin [Streptomyces qinzhouensis]|uniref:Type II toxin-antitoxin system PemK/MazF family toxin n=1 Tax=Streptomyces qinzhouensis TaxID=2599401 RepID=A0A5B8II01_9ACTN|nr:type II toxin-antitoxin system PemK/MazF family toxin [Streptomyces qinzhouensis]QDY76919.1 type II toxin-antitoxin system PemK/MazF family toxin [Streptomyces qinzhouensis]
MNTSWWPYLAGAVVLLALLVAVVDARGRSGRKAPPSRRPPERRPPSRPPILRARRLRPGDIWWAEVPYEDGPGSKDRPCLVLSVSSTTARVAKITSRRNDTRPGVIPLPPGTVGDTHDRPSFLETDELRDVHVTAFRRRVGTLPPELWGRVRHLAG